MNQILVIPKVTSYVRFFKIQLIFSIFLLIFSFCYLSFLLFFSNSKQEPSSKILDSYRVLNLYSSTDVAFSEKTTPVSPFILGTISIEKLGIYYPVISDFSDDLLKISICRFYGPLDSSCGNLCLAGHNYNDGSFFSKLPSLNIGDKICIEFWDNTYCEYYLYDKYETNLKDTSCTLQETNGKKEITLVTCNNFNGNRMIFKAREI